MCFCRKKSTFEITFEITPVVLTEKIHQSSFGTSPAVQAPQPKKSHDDVDRFEVEPDEWPTPPDSPLLQRCALAIASPEPVANLDIFSFAKEFEGAPASPLESAPASPNLEDPPVVSVQHLEHPAVDPLEHPSGFHRQSPSGFRHYLQDLVISEVRDPRHGEVTECRDDQRKLPKKDELRPRSEVQRTKLPVADCQLIKSVPVADHDQHDQLHGRTLDQQNQVRRDHSWHSKLHGNETSLDHHPIPHDLVVPGGSFQDTESTIDIESSLVPSLSSSPGEVVPRQLVLPQRTLEALPSWNFDTLRGGEAERWRLVVV